MEALRHWFHKKSRHLFLLMLVAGLSLTVYSVFGFSYTRISQARLEKEFVATVEASPGSSPPQQENVVKNTEPPEIQHPPKQGSAVFRLEIPKIKLDNIVLYGSDDETLKKGPGVVEDYSLPWLGSNTPIAGHRDTFFYRFGELAPGDEVRVITKDKMVLTYKISKISIVEPEETSVMDPTPIPTLTLITCWPLRWIGTAPQRLIVQAEIVADKEGGGRIP